MELLPTAAQRLPRPEASHTNTNGGGGITTTSTSGGGKRRQRHQKLDYLDGLRGVAACVVVAYHMYLMFAPAYVMSLSWPEQRQGAMAAYNGQYRLPSAAERALLFFPLDARMAVAVFFVLSGRVLVASYMAKADPPTHAIASAAIRRLFRLGLPAVPVVLVALGLERGHLIYNSQAAAITKAWFAGMLYGRISVPKQTLTDAWRLLLSLFLDNEMTPEHTIFLKYREQSPPFFVGVLWTLRFEFRGSMLLFLAAVILKAIPPASRPFIYAALLGWFHLENHWLNLFVLGLILCDLETTFAPTLRRALASRRPAVSAGLWAVRALLAYAWVAASCWSVPYLNDSFEARATVGAPSALALLALTPPLQCVLRTKPLQFLGRISFSLYLWHMTVLFSLGCFTFYTLFTHHHASYALAVLAAAAVTVAASIAVAYLATRLFDDPAVAFGRWLVARAFTPPPSSPSLPPTPPLAKAEGGTFVVVGEGEEEGKEEEGGVHYLHHQNDDDDGRWTSISLSTETGSSLSSDAMRFVDGGGRVADDDGVGGGGVNAHSV